MKKILIILVLLFSSSVFADDISDLQIEGMSLGDSLLDFMSEKEILNQIALGKDDYSWTDQKFAEIYIYDGIKAYEYFSAAIKRKDKKYIIHSVRGLIDYNIISECLEKKNIITKEFDNIFKNIQKDESTYPDPYDDTGEGTVYRTRYIFDLGGEIEVTCYDFAKHMNEPSGLDVSINSKEFDDWLNSF